MMMHVCFAFFFLLMSDLLRSSSRSRASRSKDNSGDKLFLSGWAGGERRAREEFNIVSVFQPSLFQLAYLFLYYGMLMTYYLADFSQRYYYVIIVVACSMFNVIAL
jgi:hypothetical protein